jgi:membrane-associated protease RseP (regulator of RpoE activity)
LLSSNWEKNVNILLGRWSVVLLMLGALHAGARGQETVSPKAPAAIEISPDAQANESLAPQPASNRAAGRLLLQLKDDGAGVFSLSPVYAEEYSHRLAIDLEDHLIAANPLGIEVTPVEEPLRLHLKLPAAEGLIVTKAPPESEGAKAGLQQHDVILRVVERPVGDVAAFIKALQAQEGEKPLRLSIVREGKPLAVEAVIRPARVVALNEYTDLTPKVDASQAAHDRYRIGVTLADVDATLRAQLKLPEGHGLVVTEVVPESAAAEAGIQANDILISLDGHPLTLTEKVNEQVQSIGDRKVTLKFLRAGEEQSIEIAPRKVAAAKEEAPTAAWLGLATLQNCQSCHQNPHGDYRAVHGTFNHLMRVAPHTPLLYWSDKAPPAGDAGEQLNKLKAQLAEMQATLGALEATLAETPDPAKKE